MKRILALAAIVLVGVTVGAGVTFAVRDRGGVADAGRVTPRGPGVRAPDTYLVWVPRGLPDGFTSAVTALGKTGLVATVDEGIVWLRRSWGAAGEPVDDPPGGYRFPLDTAAVDPWAFAPFLPESERALMAEVHAGGALLGATSARLRGLGPGAVLDIDGIRIPVVGVVPDASIGAAEMLVSDALGARLGVDAPRYLLIKPADGYRLRVATLRAALEPLLPASLGVNRAVQIREPGDTPFFRAGDAVLPPVFVKTLFGEFAAKPRADGSLAIDPAWRAAHIVTSDLPMLGSVTCHRQIVPLLEAAVDELVAAGNGSLLRSEHGCFVPRFIGWDPDNLLSMHAWGVAIDLNLAGNYRGARPHQDAALVGAFDRWGFQWGGTWIVPDGNHFEYRRQPQAT